MRLRCNYVPCYVSRVTFMVRQLMCNHKLLPRRCMASLIGSNEKFLSPWKPKVASANCKTFVPHSHVPYGKDGTGSYSEHNTPAIPVIETSVPLVVSAVQSMDIKPGSVFTAVDYGAADGGTSMQLWYACVKAVREKYGDKLPVNIIYEDQPVNDFKSLFMRTQGLIPGSYQYTHQFSNVFVLASGTNFYEQCLPNNTVNLGFSSTSMHWLSRKPCDLKEAIFIHDHLNVAPQEFEIFREQAAKDWEKLLLHRAAELVPGGRMIIATLAVDDINGYVTSGPTNTAKNGLFDRLTFYWKQMQLEGLITKDEFQSTNFNLFFQTMEELKKPFATESAVKQAGLELMSIEIRSIKNLHRETWLKEKGSPRNHAKRLLASAKEFTYSTFIKGLSDDRSVEEKNRLADELYQRYEDEISKSPEDHGWDMINAYMVLHKQS